MRTLFRLTLVVATVVALFPPVAHSQPVPELPDSVLDFGPVPFPATAYRDLRLVNSGDAPFYVVALYIDDTFKFKLTSFTGFTVMPGDTESTQITYNPKSIGFDSTTVHIILYASSLDTLHVGLRGQGVQNTPHIQVSTDSVYAAIPPGEIAHFPVEIRNVGGATIDWNTTKFPAGSWNDYGLTPSSGSVIWSLPQTVDATMSSGSLAYGTYEGIARISSNDTENPTVDIHFRMDVVDIPKIAVTPSPANFGDVFVGYARNKDLTVHNTGGDSLKVSDIVPSRAEYMVNETAFVLAPGDSHTVTVTLTPVSTGPINGTLSFYSNAPQTPQHDVSLVANGPVSDPPVIQVDTDTIEVSLDWGATTDRKFGIGNVGDFPLAWTLGTSVSLVIGAPQSPAPWLSFSQTSGSVAIGGADSVTVTFDATNLSTGDYDADIVITSSDPATPVVSIPTVAHVVGYASIELSDTAFFFDLRAVGQMQTKTLGITNTAIDPLVLDSVYVTNPNFTFGSVPASIDYGDTYLLDVTFAPVEGGVLVGALVIESNAANKPVAPVILQGEGSELFSMTIPDSVVVTAGQQEWETAPASITNGSSALQSVRAESFSGAAATVLYDNFEDLDLAGWTEVSNGAIREIVPGGTESSLFAFRESNAAAGLSNGIFRSLPAVQAHDVSFWVRPGQDDKYSSYVTFRDAGNRDAIFFIALDDGRFYVNANTGGDQSFQYLANQWYFVEFRDIDWTTKTFDYYVDGDLVKAGISVRNVGLVNEFSRVDLFSYSAGASAEWDNLWIAWGEHPAWLTLSPQSLLMDPGATDEIQLRIQTGALTPGRHDAVVALRSNSIAPTLLTFPVSVVVDSVLTGAGDGNVPAVTSLHQNHPNPFNPTTTIRYDLRDAAHVSLTVYAVDGARVRALVARDLPAGTYEAPWDGTDDRGARVASGVYFYRLVAGSYTRTLKMVLLK